MNRPGLTLNIFASFLACPGADLSLALQRLVYVAALPEYRKQTGEGLPGVLQQKSQTRVRRSHIPMQGIPVVIVLNHQSEHLAAPKQFLDLAGIHAGIRAGNVAVVAATSASCKCTRVRSRHPTKAKPSSAMPSRSRNRSEYLGSVRKSERAWVGHFGISQPFGRVSVCNFCFICSL